MTLLSLEFFLVLAGLYLAALTVDVARDAAHPRRLGSAVFWGLLAAVFIFGKHVPPVVVGYAVLAMALLVGLRQVAPPRREGRPAAERELDATRLGNALLWPVALIPVRVIAGGLALEQVKWGQGLAGAGDRDFLAGGDTGEQARELGLGLVDVDDGRRQRRGSGGRRGCFPPNWTGRLGGLARSGGRHGG